MHQLLPRGFTELGMGVFHSLSYQSAKKSHIPHKGVTVARAGLVFGEALFSDAVILGVNGTDIVDLEGFNKAMLEICKKNDIKVRFDSPPPVITYMCLYAGP